LCDGYEDYSAFQTLADFLASRKEWGSN